MGQEKLRPRVWFHHVRGAGPGKALLGDLKKTHADDPDSGVAFSDSWETDVRSEDRAHAYFILVHRVSPNKNWKEQRVSLNSFSQVES